MLALIVGAILMQAEPPTAEPPANVARPTTTVPDWRRRPTGLDMAKVYPNRAMRMGLDGVGVIRCDVTAQGTMANCVVAEEGPPGYGFGEAALKLAPLFVMRPPTRNGVAVDGSMVTIPIRFVLPR